MALMEYNGYHAQIEFDSEDQIFVGSVIGINDSLSFHGSSVDELKKNFKQSVDNYLVLCEKVGKSPEKEYRGNINIRLTPSLHKSAALYSAEDHISINQFIVEAVQEKCRAREQQTNLAHA
ncbi:MAG: type II toxin-antitoxin system HicB family antitoxin [Firmicutes bacterium]|nr:type II toxin-antitoxin system HicB family antitoxin [Bacillota bacterium]